MSDPKYLFIWHTYDRGIPAKIVSTDFAIVNGRISVYNLIEKHRNFELYLVQEKCDSDVWREYFDKHKSLLSEDAELKEYQRLKQKYEK